MVQNGERLKCSKNDEKIMCGDMKLFLPWSQIVLANGKSIYSFLPQVALENLLKMSKPFLFCIYTFF